MTPEFVTGMAKNTIEVILLVSAPVLIAAMAVGLAISIFQAVTQIQEMTLSFVPKIIITSVVLLLFSPWMMEVLLKYTSDIFSNIPEYIR